MLIFEDCANSALPARFLPLPRRFFCVRMARDASGGMFRMRRKDGAICGAASAAPRAISFLRRNGALCLRRPILFCLARKEWGEKRRWRRRIALTRLKKHFASACHSLIVRSARNALRAVRRISAIQKSCCGKYFCLQNRKVFALNPCGAFRFCPFLLRSLYWLRKRNGPSEKSES